MLKQSFEHQNLRILRFHSSGCKFKIYTQFYTQKLRYGKIFCDILILGEFYKRLTYINLRIL